MLVSAVPMQIPSGLGALLAKLGLHLPTEGEQLGGGLVKADAQGLAAHAGKEGALAKGVEIGPDGELLSGLGFNGADKETPKKNIVEKANVERFLTETKVERSEKDNPFSNLGESLGREGAEVKDKASQQKEVAEQRETINNEVRREEVADEARVVAHHEAEVKERAEKADVEELPAREQQRDEDEEDKPGAGWYAEELEEEEAKHKRGLRDADIMGDTHRCHGHVADGARCLRKPVKGTPYCREHAAGWKLVRPIEKA